MLKSSNIKYIDLFSGAGGLSEGFLQEGFEPIAHVELDKSACDTLETRLAYHKLANDNNITPYNKYIKGQISRDTFISKYSTPKIKDSIINQPIGKKNSLIFELIDKLLGEQKVDLIIGGPPCQAYSLVGRARDANGMKDDHRNHLYKEYAKFLNKYKPQIFVFENVLGLITTDKGRYFKNMQSYFKRIGYEIDYKILNTSDFGIIQNRKRIILIGWKKCLPLKYPIFIPLNVNYSIKDIFSDLKSIQPGEQNNVTEYSTTSTEYARNFNIRDNERFVTQHITRPHNDNDLKIYKIAIDKWLNNKERLKYPDLPSDLKTHKNEKSFTDRYKVVDPNGCSHTLVAHIAKDGHYYIYPDKNQIRSISVREAARIQSFPDNYYFEGGRTAAFRQIGNAVPPLLAKIIAKKIKEMLCKAH